MEAQLDTHEQSRVGMDKMYTVYKDNPKLGNANDVELQMKQNNIELHQIKEKIEHFRVRFFSKI